MAVDCQNNNLLQPKGSIRVLLVDDSSSSLKYLSCIIQADEYLEVCGTAKNAEEALLQIKRLKPDVVTMDINMPGWDGYKTTRHIMETQPLPIVIISSYFDPLDTEKAFQAMQAGAVAALPKPPNPYHAQYQASVSKLLRTIRNMSQVKVIRRLDSGTYVNKKIIKTPKNDFLRPAHNIRIIAIGASTGGPVVLQQILSGLPPDFPIPILVVQHIAQDFLQGMLQWLNNSIKLQGIIPEQNSKVRKGGFYLAPESVHMGIDSAGLVQLQDTAEEYGVRPSVAHLFRSVAKSYGSGALGILLSGMGKDGALELKSIREKGGMTIAQSKESALINGMPGEAVKLGAAVQTMSSEEIAEFLISLK